MSHMELLLRKDRERPGDTSAGKQPEHQENQHHLLQLPLAAAKKKMNL